MPELLSLVEVRPIVEACHARMGRPLSHDLLDDVVQEVSLVALDRDRRFQGRSKFETWVYGVARYEILRTQRALLGRASKELPEDVPGTDETHAAAAGSGTRCEIRARLLAFGSTAAEIFMARDGLGESLRAVSERLSISLAAARARYYRCLPRVRERLEPIWKQLHGE